MTPTVVPTFKDLFVNHQLNPDELVRRLNYWIDEAENGNKRAIQALRNCAGVLHTHKRDHFYFEDSL